jgi:hypothetical protein
MFENIGDFLSPFLGFLEINTFQKQLGVYLGFPFFLSHSAKIHWGNTLAPNSFHFGIVFLRSF